MASNNNRNSGNDTPYDLIVIGAGTAGLTSSGFAGLLKAKVALIEKDEFLGGDCTWTGCVPSKALIKVARTAHEVRTAHKYGISTTEPQVDMVKVREYIQTTIQEIYQHETREEFSKRGVEIILGEARFVDSHTIQVNDRLMNAKHFIIATGARPLLPNIKGLSDVPYKTNLDMFDNEVLPQRLLVIGAGPIGMEIGQAYSRLGAQVTLVGEHMLPRDEPEVADVMRTVFEREGIQFIMNLVTEVHQVNDEIIARLNTGEEVRADMLFLATGRKPNVQSLDLQNANVDFTEHGVNVNKSLRTNQAHIYAAGDCIGAPFFTHNAAFQGVQAARSALLPGSSVGISDTIPWVTFTSPEVAHAGLTEAEARQKYGNTVKTFVFQASHGDRTITEDDMDGFLKFVYKGSGKLLGATIVAERAGEMIIELILAMKYNLSITQLTLAIHPYPTYSEITQRALFEVFVKELFDGMTGKIIGTYTNWRFS